MYLLSSEFKIKYQGDKELSKNNWWSRIKWWKIFLEDVLINEGKSTRVEARPLKILPLSIDKLCRHVVFRVVNVMDWMFIEENAFTEGLHKKSSLWQAIEVENNNIISAGASLFDSVFYKKVFWNGCTSCNRT